MLTVVGKEKLRPKEHKNVRHLFIDLPLVLYALNLYKGSRQYIPVGHFNPECAADVTSSSLTKNNNNISREF